MCHHILPVCTKRLVSFWYKMNVSADIIPEWMELHFSDIDLTDIAHLSKMLNDQLGNLDNFKNFVANALMDRSASRWGNAKYPSMVWADVEDHQYQKLPLPNVYQIFGHT